MRSFRSTLEFDSEKLHTTEISGSHTFALLNDKTLQTGIFKTEFMWFLIRIRNEYPSLSELAVHKLLPSCTTHLCEAAFSPLVIIKSKKRSFLKNVEEFVLAALSNCISLRMDDLCTNHQVHPSHSLCLITSIN